MSKPTDEENDLIEKVLNFISPIMCKYSDEEIEEMKVLGTKLVYPDIDKPFMGKAWDSVSGMWSQREMDAYLISKYLNETPSLKSLSLFIDEVAVVVEHYWDDVKSTAEKIKAFIGPDPVSVNEFLAEYLTDLRFTLRRSHIYFNGKDVSDLVIHLNVFMMKYHYPVESNLDSIKDYI